LVTATTTVLPTLRDASGEQHRLVSAAAARDPKAFAELYGQYSRNVYNLILRSVRNKETAEDVAQEVWIKVYRDLPRLREARAFPAWLYQMTSKTCVDAARKRTRSPQASELSDDVPARGDDPEHAALGGHDAQLTREALAALPAHQHLALFLREVDDRSYREISQVLGISETAVGLCLMRARRSFARAYARLDTATQQERCEQIQANVARVHDGEATPVQRKAVDGHLASCVRCREDARLMREGSKRYATLALAPVPAALNAKVLAAAGLGAAGGLGSAAGFVGILAGKVKMAFFAVLAIAGIGAGVAVTPGARSIVWNGVSHAGDVPLVGQIVDGGGARTDDAPRPPGAPAGTGHEQSLPGVNAVEQSAVSTPVPGEVQVPVPAGGAVTQLTGALATIAAPLGIDVPTVAVAVPELSPIVPTVVAAPSQLVPENTLPALPPVLPTVTVGGLDLP